MAEGTGSSIDSGSGTVSNACGVYSGTTCSGVPLGTGSGEIGSWARTPGVCREIRMSAARRVAASLFLCTATSSWLPAHLPIGPIPHSRDDQIVQHPGREVNRRQPVHDDYKDDPQCRRFLTTSCRRSLTVFGHWHTLLALFKAHF